MDWFSSLLELKGNACFYYKNLVTGQVRSHQPDVVINAASVIKIPIMVEAFRQFEAGLLREDERFTVSHADHLPSCGALTYMHDGLQVNALDLVTLMITLSDNTATNMLIKRLGIERIAQTMADIGLENTKLRRLLFEAEKSRQGIKNTITAREIGLLLERMTQGKLISPAASKRMLDILACQRLNGKMPFYLHSEGVKCAHKTGEDDGVTHDVGVVYAGEPFIVCFCSEGVDVPRFERIIQEATADFAGIVV